MSQSNQTRSIIAVLTVFASLILLLGCQTASTNQGYERAERGENQTFVPVPAGVEQAEIRAAVLHGLTRRGWTIQDDAAEPIQATLSHRGIDARLEVATAGDSIVITSDSYDEAGVPFVPVRWINYLQGDIEERLAAAAVAN